MNRQIVHGAAASVVYTATTVIAGAVQLRFVTRVLPAPLAGLWLLFVAIGSYVAWFDLGISPTVGREISFLLGGQAGSEEQRNHRIAELLISLWRLFRILAAGVGLLSLGIGEVVLRNTPTFSQDSAVRWAWVVFSLGVALNLLGSTAFAGLIGIGSVAPEKLIRAVASLVGLGFAITALQMGWGIVGLSAAWLIQGALAGGAAWWRLRRQFPHFDDKAVAPNWPLVRKLAAPSLKLAFIQLGAILILQSANPLIAVLIGPAAIPPYEALARIGATLMTLALLIVNSSAPYFSMAYAARKKEEFALLLIRNLRFGLGLIIVLSAFVAINGDRIISVWLGAQMFAGFAVVWVILFTVLLEVHHVIFATAVMSAGQIVFSWAALGSGILNIVLAVMLGTRFGLLGIALAVSIGQLLTNNWYAP